MKQQITKTLLLLLLTMILFIPNEHVSAVGVPRPVVSPGDGEESEETIPYIEGDVIGDIRHKYVCEYNYSGGGESKIDINAYDIEGNSVIPHTNVTGAKFKAGTFVGINLREFSSISWGIFLKDPYEIYNRITITYQLNLNSYEVQRDIEICSSTDPNLDTNIRIWACNQLSSCISGTTEEPFYYGDSEEDRWNKRIAELEAQKKSNAYCILNYTPERDVKGGGAPDKITKRCQSKIVRNVILGISGGMSPTIQFNIKDPNDYNKADIAIASQTKEGTIKGKVKEFKQEEPIPVVVCNNPLIEIPFVVSPDPGHTKTYMPVGGIGAIAGMVDEDNYGCFLGGAYYVTYEYSPGKTCINVKNSKVTYKKETDSCDSKTEKELEPGKTKDPYLNPGSDEEVEYWQYFIPFNTPTTDSEKNSKNEFFIRVESITPSSSELGKPPECMEFLRRYPAKTNSKLLKYSDLIIAISPDGKERLNLVGDYHDDYSEATSSDMQLFKNGYNCQISTKLKFNIAQHFYGENKEEDETTEIAGYSFYYRPINIDKPFPNKISGNSIWLDLYDEAKNEINVTLKNSKKVITTKLSDSYKEVTYSTKGVSRNEILKKIDSNENYTSWKNISAQYGTSSFITELNLRTSANNTKDLYKLGCGPDNLDWSGCK